MGQCFSAPSGDAGQQWQVGGLSPFDAGARQYGGLDQAKPAGGYTTTADVGMKPQRGSEDKSAHFAFMHDKPAPPPLQLERIEEDATLNGEGSPMKQLPMPASDGSGNSGGAGSAVPSGQHVQRKPICWTKGELVGQGAFGSVFVAMDNDTGELIAVKQVHIPRGGGAHAKKVEDNIRSVEEEVQLLQQFDHPNIVRYLGTEKTEDALNIFLEYVPGGSIASLLAKFGSFKESVIKVYTKQLLLGLEYLHSKGVMHRDIKGANILVDNTGLVKLADFGASKKLEDLVTVADGNKSVRGTPYWMAPEVITQTGHGRQADMWSVACTVLEMATGRPPWSTQYPSQVAAMFHIASSKGPPEIPQHLTPECKDFLYLCFNRDWKARPLAATLLRHPFLADVPVRSHNGGPSPNAVALAQNWRAPRTSGLSVTEPSDSQFGTPSPLNPKLAGMPGGAARISLQTSEGTAMMGDSSAALSPLGQHAATRRPQWDSAATPVHSQQQQQQFAVQAAREPSMAGRGGGSSPMKRPAISLRASAPALSGYASVALSQQSEQLAPRPRRPAAPAQEQEQPQQGGGATLRGSRESVLSGGPSAQSGATSGSDTASQQQSVLRRSNSRPLGDREASSSALAIELPEERQEQGVAAAGAGPEVDEVCSPAEAAKLPEPEASETPSALRQRPGVQDPLQPAVQATPGQAGAPDSVGTSSGTNKSDYNPMEEPSWMQPHGSPLLGEATPMSALSAGNSPAPLPAASSDAVASNGAAATPAAAVQPVRNGAGMPKVAPAAAAAGFDQHPSAEHMVWTNDDGDIDALPWDMGGWSTGSSADRAAAAGEGRELRPPAKQAGSPEVEAEPVDEDALIGALRRKAQHDMRASMALFERSLNIPAVHGPPSPKAAAASPDDDSSSPRTIAAVRGPVGAAPPAMHAQQPPARQSAQQAVPAAESIESLGAPCGPAFSQSGAGPVVAAAADESRRRAVHNVLSGARPTATGAPPALSPLQAAVGGLAELGYGSGSFSGGKGGDRESVWQQELSQELFRVKGAAAAAVGGPVPNRRVSMHGSPLKSRLHVLHP